jgi:hypothetical protein
MTLAASNASAKAFWFLNRAAAGVVAAALSGACVGAVVFCYVLATSKGSGPGADFLGGLIYTIYFFTLCGTVMGAAPGVIVMCFSRAKMAPWRSDSARREALSAAGVGWNSTVSGDGGPGDGRPTDL